MIDLKSGVCRKYELPSNQFPNKRYHIDLGILKKAVTVTKKANTKGENLFERGEYSRNSYETSLGATNISQHLTHSDTW